MKISGWILLLMIIIYFVSGYALVREYGFDRLMSHKDAWKWHNLLTIPFFIALFIHIFPVFYFASKDPKNFWKKLFW
jgi:uncharacterized BrkB/YihY/UPF0761 family membrane protein